MVLLLQFRGRPAVMHVRLPDNIVDILNRKEDTTKWRWVDKDIIYDIAKELNTNSERVETFYKGMNCQICQK